MCWSESLKLIKENVTDQQYATWFAQMVFESYNDRTKTLLIRVPSTFVYEYIEEHFIDLFSRVLKQTFSPKVRLTYRVATDKEHKPTQDIETTKAVTKTASKRAEKSQPTFQTVEETAKEQLDSQLNPQQTFETFIEGDSNKLPRSVGLAIAEHPNNSQFNPMFIFGPSGCGKTHLINAIGVRTKQLYPQKRVLYISSRLFQVQYTNAVRQNTINEFINFYQTIDMLIVDDIQEWVTAGKTQDTFFHIFNHLFKNGKRIILASDRPPVDLQGMNERLLTRFACGLIAELEKPNVQLCIDILHSKIKRDGISIPEDVIQYIAQTANGSVRDLQGVINSLLAYSVVYNSNIDMRLTERIVKRSVKIDDKPLTIDDIIEQVSKYFKVTPQLINGKSRKKEIVIARQVSMYLAQKHTKMTAGRIGKLIGNRDHSTVLHSCSQIKNKMENDRNLAQQLQQIEKKFHLKPSVG